MAEIWQIILREGVLADYWKVIPHFLSSGFAGLLAYRWMSITLSRYYFGAISFRVLRKDVYGIHRYSLYLALAFAIFVHVLEDYTLNWF